MTEKQMQSKIIVWFSQVFPHMRGRLFQIDNDTYSQKHGMSKRAMGTVSGVADLCFINSIGQYCGIELKAPGSTHSKNHIENQVQWGEKLYNLGGSFILTSSSAEIKHFIMSDGCRQLSQQNIQKQKQMLLNSGKTIKF